MASDAVVPVWIFLRGLTRGSGHWAGFVGEFEQIVDGARVLVLDTAGNGARHALTSPCTVEEMVQDCRAQLIRMGVAPPYNLFALSLGAMVAAHWLSQWPQELARTVLVNTSMRPFNPFYERLRPASYMTLLKVLAAGSTALQREQAILHLTTRHPQHDVLAQWVTLRQSNPVSVTNALRQLLAAARFRLPDGVSPDSQMPGNKLLLLAARGDRLVSFRCTLALAGYWNCAARLHPTAGHDLPLDDGPWVANQVRLWLHADGALPAPGGL